MSRWFFPSWNGDFRLLDATETSYRDRVDGCVLEVVNATDGEREKLDAFLRIAVEKKWTALKKLGQEERQEILLSISLDEAGKALLPILKPADRTITAIKSEGGKLVVHDTAEMLATPVVAGDAVVDNADVPGLPAKKPKKEETKASLARPTPSCPQCVPGAITRASEVLLAFLSPEEHAMWAAERHIIVTGGLTGCRYVLAHRHSPLAARIGRICFDIDSGVVVHFHDNSVPPEEEVLAAKLILEHREPWLRNEATMLGRVYGFSGGEDHLLDTDGMVVMHSGTAKPFVFKNPFGDVLDGVWDAHVSQKIGKALAVFGG